MLKLDVDFKETYFKYYGNTSPFKAVHKTRQNISTNTAWTVISFQNIIKTADLLSMSYIEYYMEAVKEPGCKHRDPDELDMFLFDIAFDYLLETRLPELESFLGIRFKVRDIYKEMAVDAFGKASPENIEKVKSIKTEDTYSIQIPNPVSRDRWFYNLAVSVGSYSKCHSRKIGAVLVKDKSVISTGYNGPPRGVPTCDQRWFIDESFRAKYGHHLNNLKSDAKVKGVCPRRIIGFPSGQGLGVCPAGHAERNALINAAKLGIKTDKTKLYMTCGVPCTPCMVEIINSGVEELVCSSMHIYDETAMYLLENSDIKVRLFDFLV